MGICDTWEYVSDGLFLDSYLQWFVGIRVVAYIQTYYIIMAQYGETGNKYNILDLCMNDWRKKEETLIKVVCFTVNTKVSTSRRAVILFHPR